ncbi:collagen binding domain-containing protein [uncultured Gemmiger sp.]|uniref:MSCRAMM family protein n=1 Tax=uncultured Gemmiger sp. TaxID=1623490 RepID=UPI0025FFA554|nr:SpaA isopeptide-forming pilin-related protein [uncultured Gemmiger sp.]
MTGLKKALRSRRGFTLVELVVVLVIAGITASFAVPALTGYIDNAKEKQAVSETQACVMAATRIAAQKYALVQNASITGKSDGANALTSWAGELKNEAPTVTGDVALTEGSGQYLLHMESAPIGSKTPDDLASQAGVSGTVQWMTCNASGQVVYLVYTSADGIQVVYTATGTNARVDGSIDNIVVPKPDDTKPEPNPNPEPAPGPEPTLLEVTILKVDASTKLPLGDAELQILNEDGTAAASWTSSTSSSGHSVSLPVGNYVLRETSAPGNYDIAADIKFVIASNGDTLSLSGDSGVSATSITMEDEKVDYTKSDKVFIHLQDAVTGSSSNFANKTYTVTVPYPKITYDVTADANGNIPFEIYDEASGKTIQNGQLPAWKNDFTITEKDPIPGYQPLKEEHFSIQINKSYKDGKYLGCTFSQFIVSGETNGTFADGNVITLQYFPTAVVKILTTDEDNKPLADAFFDIIDTSTNETIFKNLRSDSQGYCSVPLQLNSGDGMTDTVYLNSKTTYKLIEVTAPTGYQSGVNCSLAFNFSPYPNAYMKTHGEQRAAYNTWFKLNIYNNNYGEWGRVEQYGDNSDIIHVVNSKKLTCTTYLYKIDDAGNPVSDAKLALRSKDGNHILLDFDSGGGGTPNLSSYQSFITNSVPYVVQLRRGKTYELEEITPPQNYTKAEKITFTVPSGADTFTVSMTDHNSSEDKSDIKFDKVTFNQANNWAHKLTTDDKISFSGGEILFWKGIAYYNYDNVNTKIPNSKRNTYEKNPTKLNNAPDPMEFLSNHLKKENPNQKAADYIVPLTGKAYHYNDENVTLQKGDIVIPEDYGDGVPEDNKNKKVYVYIGNKDLPLTNETLSNKDEKENFTTLEHKPQDKDNKTYNFTLNP